MKFFSLFILFIMCTYLVAGQNIQTKEILLTDTDKESAVNSISRMLYENYIFPEVSLKMENYIKLKLSEHKYDSVSDPVQFAEQLTNDLQSVSKDKHIRVQYNPDQIRQMKEHNLTNDEEITQEYIDQLKTVNYFFKKVEILNGNIGYIDFRQFGPGDQIKDKVASVMGFVENCDALIFDMRYNGGGDPTGIQVISSYLFGDEPVHLNDLYYRPNDTTEEFWTLKDIKGKRMPDVPVYVLTSSFTFSGAEEFSYNLQNLKRATIVGETTGGGAHPGGMNIVDDNFLMFVPVGRAINPISKTNWEGTGVSPDVEINSTKALIKAQILALEIIKQNSANEKEKQNSDWLIESLSATLEDVNISPDLYKKYSGVYGERKIYFENGKLYYQRSGRQKFEMTPMSEDTFMISEIGFFRLKFVSDSSGNISEVIGLYSDGHTDNSLKNF